MCLQVPWPGPLHLHPSPSVVPPQDRPHLGDPPLAIVTRAWRQYVFGDDERIDRKAFVFCFLDRLRSALRRRDLFIAPSFRYADARIGLLSGPAWESARPAVCRSLGHSLSAEETLVALGRQLNQTYQQVATNLSSNPLARVEKVDDKDELVLTSPDRLEEPPSLARLRNEIAAQARRGSGYLTTVSAEADREGDSMDARENRNGYFMNREDYVDTNTNKKGHQRTLK
ncbi:MAG TPA: hypothetical protein VGX93_03040 [Chthoniobacterales bacterium]|nr:hypothetical protein [Chthoniobacterales bacterium]